MNAQKRPAVTLDDPGEALAREGRSTYELANGQPVEHDYGFARVSFMGEKTVAPVVLGPVGCEPILGAVALESVGIMVDPVTRTLERLPAKPLK